MVEITNSDYAKLRKLLCISAYIAYSSNIVPLCENNKKRGKFFSPQLYAQPYSPVYFQPGQLVMEVSTIWDRSRDPTRIGYVISDREEPCFTDEFWEAEKAQWDGIRPNERVTRIALLPEGSNFAWNNATFIRVAEGLFSSIVE